MASETPTKWNEPVSWPFVAYVAAFFVLIIFAAAIREPFQPVTKTMDDYLVVWGVAVLVFAGLYVLRRRRQGLTDARSRAFVFALGTAYMIGFFGRSAFLALNAALDGGPSRSYGAVIERVGCGRGGGTWWLVGAPSIPAPGNRMSIVGAGCAPAEGDSVVVEVKPGFLRRPWVANYGHRY